MDFQSSALPTELPRHIKKRNSLAVYTLFIPQRIQENDFSHPFQDCEITPS